MAEEFSMDAAKDIIDGGIAKAQELMGDPERITELISDLDKKIMGFPDTIKSGLTAIPDMASMVKSYITKEYTEVSPKVVASLVSAFLYLLTKKDLIRDDIPVLGYADDLAVVALAVKLNEPEIEAFKAWREANPAPADSAAPAEA